MSQDAFTVQWALNGSDFLSRDRESSVHAANGTLASVRHKLAASRIIFITCPQRPQVLHLQVQTTGTENSIVLFCLP